MNYYYEFSDQIMTRFDFPKYVKLNLDRDNWSNAYMKGTNLGHMAERIWSEDGCVIKFVKNSRLGYTADVDLKEFMWIKLKS